MSFGSSQSKQISRARSRPTGSFLQVAPLDERFVRWFKLAATSAESLVLIAGALGVIGWAFGVEALKHPTDEPALQSAASINFVLLSTAILLLCVGAPKLWRKITGRSLAAIVMVASAMTFIEHTCHLYWEDLVLWKPNEGFGLTYPGPLLPHESFFFFLLGLGAILFNVVLKERFFPSQILAAAVFVPSFIVLICCLLGQAHLCIYFGCVQLSPICSLVFSAYSLGLFFASPDTGAAKVFSVKSKPGILARRALVGVGILIAALLPRRWLIEVGERTQLVDSSMVNIGTAIVAFFALCFFGWRAIEAVHQESEAEEAKLRKLVCLTCITEYTDESLVFCPKDGSTLIRLIDNLRPGARFDGRYLIVKELGSGGMSTVYLAEHLLMKKNVAVKVLQTQCASDPKTIQRFQRESQATSGLSHPNLVNVYDFNVTEEGQAYMVMEFLEGESLSELIYEREAIPWHEALPLFLDVCEGLEHAHSKGVIHRDLKPGNIMLLPAADSNGQFIPKIVDFGLAKVFDNAASQLTQPGEVFGSPHYMSPEQCRGQDIDQRSDIYAMGCIMYATLVGRPPFEGSSIMETVMMHMKDPLPGVPPSLEVPAWLQAIMRKATAKDPEKRYQSVSELKLALANGAAAS